MTPPSNANSTNNDDSGGLIIVPYYYNMIDFGLVVTCLGICLSCTTISLILDTKKKNAFLKTIVALSSYDIIMSTSTIFMAILLSSHLQDNQRINLDMSSRQCVYMLFFLTLNFGNLALLLCCSFISMMFTHIAITKEPWLIDHYFNRIMIAIFAVSAAISIPCAYYWSTNISSGSEIAVYTVETVVIATLIGFNVGCSIYTGYLISIMPLKTDKDRKQKNALVS